MYVPPSYQFLFEQTQMLLDNYYEVAKRYESPSYAELRGRCKAMRSEYCRVVSQKPSYQLSSPDEERLKQIGYISHLTSLLPKTHQDDSPSQNVLLGALFYRYMTIQDRYKGWSFFGWTEENSALFRIIEKILGLSKRVPMPDDLTLATCCQAYHDYLLKLSEVNDEQKKAIPQDSHLFATLRNTFHLAKVRAEPMIQAISTLELIPRFLIVFDAFRQEIDGSIEVLLSKLAKKLDISDELTKEDIKSILQESVLKDRVAMMLAIFLEPIPKDFILNKGAIPSFKQRLTGSNLVNSQYALLGFYIVIFERAKNLSRAKNVTDKKNVFDDLCKVIIRATKGDGDLSAIDDETSNLALSALLNYFSLRRRPDGWGLGQYFDSFFGEVKELQKKGSNSSSLQEMIQSIAVSMIDESSAELLLSP